MTLGRIRPRDRVGVLHTLSMSDVEHELITDVAELQTTARRLGELALRALESLRDAQDASGAHDPWIDDAITDVTSELAALTPPSVEA